MPARAAPPLPPRSLQSWKTSALLQSVAVTAIETPDALAALTAITSKPRTVVGLVMAWARSGRVEPVTTE
ncbi:MAG: hypothetical protein IPM94_12935 [bacterium]|nr:hypothetical protein [bacterium]